MTINKIFIYTFEIPVTHTHTHTRPLVHSWRKQDQYEIVPECQTQTCRITGEMGEREEHAWLCGVKRFQQ